MPHYSSASPAVKLARRSQRKPLLRIPDRMLEKGVATFPETFDPSVAIAMFALRSLAQRINDYANEALAPFGINAAKFNYLMSLYSSPDEEMTLSELSRYIHTSNATVTSMVAALERDGYVRRRSNELDGRSSFVRLTAKGRRIVERTVPVHHGHFNAALDDFSDAERAQLAELLVRAGAGFDRHFGLDA